MQLPEDHVTILPAAYHRGISAPFIVNFLSIIAVQAINELEPGAAEGAVTFSTYTHRIERFVQRVQAVFQRNTEFP